MSGWPGLLDPDEPIGDGAMALLPARDKGVCAACGEPFGNDVENKPDIHHRNRAGRKNNLANLARFHHECHMHIHAHPEWARQRGYITGTRENPADVPIVLWTGKVMALSDHAPQYEDTGQWRDPPPRVTRSA